jgi:hypothetical protein
LPVRQKKSESIKGQIKIQQKQGDSNNRITSREASKSRKAAAVGKLKVAGPQKQQGLP